MKTPIVVRTLTGEEISELEKGLRSGLAFTVRRCQIALMSSQEKLAAGRIAERLKCSDQCVREAIHAFEAEGLASVRGKSRARHDKQQALDERGIAWLKQAIRQSPRGAGYAASLG